MKNYVKAPEVGEGYRWVYSTSMLFGEAGGYLLRLQKKRKFFGWKTVGAAAALNASTGEEVLTKHVAKVMAGLASSDVID